MTTLVKERGWTVIYTGHVSSLSCCWSSQSNYCNQIAHSNPILVVIGCQYCARSFFLRNIFLYLWRIKSFLAERRQ
jgi:hypothetical protein